MSAALTSIGNFFSPSRHPIRTAVIALVIIILCVWTFFFKKNDNAANYLTATVERADIQNLVTATGILQPRDYVDVGAQVSGQLKKLYVDVGSQVKAGDLLAEIDATVYKAKVDGIRAQLLNQQAQLGEKQAQLNLAKIQFNRQQNLYKDEATTQDSLQVAEAELQSAQAQLKSLQAQNQQTEFSLRVEEANLTYARIYAPMTGTVVTLTSRQGQTLNANQQAPTIMRIADLSTMTVQTQVSEADIGKLKVGMPVYFTTLGGQDYRWYSKLDRLEPTPTFTNNVVLYNALFDVPNDSNMLMTQMSTQVFFIAASAKNALLIPASAVNFQIHKPGEKTDPKQAWQDRKRSEAKSSDTKEVAATEKREPGKSNSSEANVDSTQAPASTQTPAEKPDANKSSPDDKAANEEGRQNRRHRPRQAPAGGDQAKPQPAVVQVIDKKGNITERKIIIGISNRVQVEVIEGLQEGENVVSGMRQPEKANNSPSAMGGPGAPGANPRMMR